MSDDKNITQNQNSDEDSIPESSQDPTELASENTTVSEPVDVLPDVPEAPQESFEVKSWNIPPSDSKPEIENQDEIKVEEKFPESEDIKNGDTEENITAEPGTKPITETVEIPESSPTTPEIEVEIETPSSAKSHESIIETNKTKSETPQPVESKNLAAQMVPFELRVPEAENKARQEVKTDPPTIQQPKELIREKIVYSLIPIKNLLGKANQMLRIGRRKRLDKILALVAQKGRIRNDDVQKLLRVSDATATRYLTRLEKEGKIKRNSKGKYLYYSRI